MGQGLDRGESPLSLSVCLYGWSRKLSDGSPLSVNCLRSLTDGVFFFLLSKFSSLSVSIEKKNSSKEDVRRIGK